MLIAEALIRAFTGSKYKFKSVQSLNLSFWGTLNHLRAGLKSITFETSKSLFTKECRLRVGLKSITFETLQIPVYEGVPPPSRA